MLKNIFKKQNIVIFMIVFAILMLTLLSFYPGMSTYDTEYQWNEIQNNNITDAHPFLTTFVMFLLSKLWNNKMIVIIFQILVFSLIWTGICNYLRKNNNFKRQVIYTIFICLIPLVFIYSITIWKDILYSYFLLMLSFMLLIGVDKKFKFSNLQLIFLAILLVFIMSYRHNGIIVVIGTLILLAITFIKKKESFKKIAIFIVTMVVMLVSIQIPKNLMCKTYQDEFLPFQYAIPSYLIGALLNDDVINEPEDIAYLDKILDTTLWKQRYDPYIINPISGSTELNKKEAMSEDSRLYEILIKYSLKSPMTIIKHYLKVDSLVINPFTKGYVYVYQFTEWGPEKYGFDQMTQPVLKTGNQILTFFINVTQKVEAIKYLSYTPAIPLYLSIILAILIAKKKKDKRYFLIILPMLLNTLSLLPTNVAQDLRYVYINYLTLIFLAAIMFFDKREIKVDKNKKLVKTGDKLLVIIPAYNEEGTIKKVVENVYEKNPKCDVVVVNDGSSDKTLIEAKKTKATIIDLPTNLGIGGAVQSGYLYALKNNYDIAIQIDGDGQHRPEYIKQMVDILVNENYDMIIGSRFCDKTKYNQTFFRMLGINITSGIIKLITGVKIYDTTSGFRAVNKEIIKMFANEYPYDYPEPGTNMQMIIKGKSIKEIPVEMKKRTTGVSSISPIKAITYMLKVSLSLLLSNLKKD